MQEKIKSLSLITSIGCNLDCNYCILHKTKIENLSYVEQLSINTKKAILDGTYLKNILIALQKFNSFPNDIKDIELWGQETTLILDSYIKVFPKWLQTFPSLKKIFFSTNGIDHQKTIIDFIKILDDNLNHPLNLFIQWSYDGTYSTNNIRANKDTPNKIYDNFLDFIMTIDTLNLKYVEVHTYLHGVISFELINSFQNNFKNIYNFRKDIDNIERELLDYKNNKLIHKEMIEPVISFTTEIPYNCSTIDGINMDYFIKNIYYAEGLIKPKNNFLHFHRLPAHWNQTLKHTFKNLQLEPKDLVQYLINNIDIFSEDFKEITKTLSRGFFCGANYSELKLMYDGTLVSCQNTMYINKLNNSSDIRKEMENIWLTKNTNFLNVNTASEEEIELYKYLYTISHESIFWHNYTLNLIHMYYLAKARQINMIYTKNSYMLLTHAFIVTYFNCCSYNNSILTGSMLTNTHGTIKRICNGWGFLLEELNTLTEDKDEYYQTDKGENY